MNLMTDAKTIEIVESNGTPTVQLMAGNDLNKLRSFASALLRDKIKEYDHPKGKELTYEDERKIKQDIDQLIHDWTLGGNERISL